ncbi:MAG TPA: hypothetical protein VHZ03_35965 [Trebonia sp.]|jgi:hypothetical protein|nr:hypothetical protein [Trebonia sp.]
MDRALLSGTGQGTDLAAGQGEDEDPAGVGKRGLRVADVEAEDGLDVGQGRRQTGGATGPERGRGRGPEPGRQLTALGPQRHGRHDQSGVLGQQGSERLHVTRLVDLSEPLHEYPLPF